VRGVKTPEERGELGAWAYETRVRLDLSVEAVAAGLPRPLNPATIRKAEGDSRNMSRPLWRALTTFYKEAARRKGVQIAQPPTFAGLPTATDQSDLARAIQSQADAINALVDVLRPIVEEAETREARLRALELAVALLAPQPDEVPQEQRAHQGNEG
jgi:hypothetical protein